MSISAPAGSLSPEGRRLLELLAAQRGLSVTRVAEEAGRGGRERARLSFSQERLWFLDQFQPGLSIYNMPFALRFDTPPEVGALERALDDVVQRHQILRTIFPAVDGQPVQQVLPAAPVALCVTDLRALASPERDARFRKIVEAEWSHVFDLSTGPLFRAQLVSLEDGNHQLLLTLHHIVCDGWSLRILGREIPALYDRHALGLPTDLAPLALQYADFAEEQRARLTDAELERHLGYWRQQLAGLPAQVALPTYQPRPREQTFRGALLFFEIGEAVSERLAGLEARYKATRFMVLLAAFKVLLFRYTGQSDLVVGTPVANRNRRELESLVGFFTNTLALRTRVSDEDNFATLLARVRDATLDAYAHQELPFEKLVQEMQPQRSLAHNPLFQIMFALQSDTRATRRHAGPRHAASRAPDAERFAPAVAKFDLALYLGEGEQGLTGEVEYNTDLFSEDFVAGLVRHFRNLLAAIAQSPDLPVHALRFLDPAERQRVLLAGPDLDLSAPVHEQIERRAADRPDAIAVVRGDARLTYREFNVRANRFARRLQQRGVVAGEAVGICLPRDFEFLIVTLAVWKVGAACVPLDAAYPAERLALQAEDAAIGLVVADAETAGRFPGSLDRLLVGEPAPDPIDAAEETDPGRGVSLDSAAYIVFTSGSTGRPKGVAVPHRTLANLVLWDGRRAASGRDNVVLHYAALGFDVSLQEIATTLAQGGVLVMIAEEQRADFEAVLDAIRRHGIRRLFLPPVALRHLAEVARTRDPPELDEIVTAGEQLDVSPAVREFCARAAVSRLCNQYGPAETHVASELQLAGSPSRWPSQPGIGRPICNVRLYILDAWLEPVPPGIFGQLFIGGCAVALGYVRRPGATAERFLPDPHASEPGARMYRTGDRARLVGEEVEFGGRIDRQLKIRGYRIEPGEIESALSQHRAVAEAVVAACAVGEGDTRLAAYYVERAGEAVTPAELRTLLGRTLPQFMVPSAFVRLDAVPLLRTGKTDIAALPNPFDAGALEGTEPAAGPALAPPTGAAEVAIAAIWSDVLGVASVGADDNFFDVGGHSLLATQVVSRIRSRMGIELTVRTVFDNPTVRAIARETRAIVAAAGDTE